MTFWGQLAAKALVSGAVIALASEVARRSPGLGGLIAALPLTTLLAIAWLWRDGAGPQRTSDFLLGTALYVLASLPAFPAMALVLRRGFGFAPALVCGAVLAIAGTYAMIFAGRRFGWPV